MPNLQKRGLASVSAMTVQMPQEKAAIDQSFMAAFFCISFNLFFRVQEEKQNQEWILSAPERRTMQIEKMPLDDRLARMLNGYSAYTEYIPCVLRSFASMPVSDFLAPYEGQWERLCALLGITELAGKDRMTYQETAARIYQGWTENRQDLAMAEAIFILSAPFRYCFEGREETHGKNKSDAT